MPDDFEDKCFVTLAKVFAILSEDSQEAYWFTVKFTDMQNRYVSVINEMVMFIIIQSYLVHFI